MHLYAQSLIKEKRNGKSLDPVSRFYLCNSTGVESLNWAVYLSQKGIDQSAGMMVKYQHDSGQIVSTRKPMQGDEFPDIGRIPQDSD